MNIFLLTERKYKDQIGGSIRGFLNLNSASADENIVWDAFKAYMPGTLIVINCHEVRERNRTGFKILQEIISLETIHKVSLQVSNYIQL